MDITTRFRINSPKVVHETFDEEVVVVNLESGRYYCLQRTSAALWHLLVQGASVQEIVDVFARQYAGEVGDIERETVGLVGMLTAEALVIEDERASRPTIGGLAVADPRPAFELPPLQSYTDMQDLLLLDPIHEVDAAGWPVARPPATD